MGIFLALILAIVAVACGGGRDGGKTVPTPLGPGEVISVSLCGSTTEPRSPCGDSRNNVIQLRVGNNSLPAVCPCFRFSFLNQNLADLGATNLSMYEFTGFRPGSYEVTGEMMVANIDFTFFHNTSMSAIGVVPSSLRSLSGPVKSSNRDCTIGYQQPIVTQLPASFRFQFTVAAGSDGGSC